MTTRVSTSLGGTGANSASAARSTLNVVSKTGDTMTGQLNITSGGLNVSAGGVNVNSSSLNVNFGTVNVSNGTFTIPAGISKMKMSDFLIYNTLGALLYMTLILYIGYFTGGNKSIIKNIQPFAIAVFVVSVSVYLALKFFNKKQ